MEKFFKTLLMCVKSRGLNISICIVYRVRSLCDILMSKLWVKNGVKNFAHMGPFVPLGGCLGGRHSPTQAPFSDKHMYLKNDVTKKCLFCLNKGVFETGLLSRAFLQNLELVGLIPLESCACK